MLHAVYTRQLDTKLRPDRDIVQDFRVWCKPHLDRLSTQVLSNLIPTNIVQEIRDKDSWSQRKKQIYINNSWKTMSRTQPWSIKDKHWYDAMVKVGEKYVVDSRLLEQLSSNTFTPGDRARLIFCP